MITPARVGIDFYVPDILMEPTTDVDLSPCSTLASVDIQVLLKFGADETASDTLRRMLNSWQLKGPSHTVRIVPYVEQQFTRRKYADLLSIIGRIMEEWLSGAGGPSNRDEAVNEHDLRRRIIVYIRDWESWRDWWWRHVEESFPTFARCGGLEMNSHMCEYTSGQAVVTSTGGSLSRRFAIQRPMTGKSGRTVTHCRQCPWEPLACQTGIHQR